MKIVIPCDWKIVDLLTTDDADDFGEALRGFCFIGTSQLIGCYSTFEVNKGFNEIKEGKIWEEAKSHLWGDTIPKVYHLKVDLDNLHICEPFEIIMGWTWDGDGCLYFRFNGRKVINTDCKKSYGWEWIKDEN